MVGISVSKLSAAAWRNVMAIMARVSYQQWRLRGGSATRVA